MLCCYQPVLCHAALQEDCNRLRSLADEFQPEDPLAAGLIWLADTLSVALHSTRSCMQAWQQQQALAVSDGYSCLQQQHPKLQLLVQQLQQQLDVLVTASRSRTATPQQVLQAARDVLLICQLQQSQQQDDLSAAAAPAAPPKNTLQWHIQAFTDAHLEPASLSCMALQRVAVQLLLLCCRLARCHHPSSSTDIDEIGRQAAATARQLGLADAVAEMPYEAANLQGPIRQQLQLLPYAAAAVADADWLLLQCRQGAVAGPVAVLQAAEMQLHATGRAFLPASYLGLRFVDVLLAMKQSLFASISAAANSRSGSTAAQASGKPQVGTLEQLERSVAAHYLSSADAAAVQGLLQAFTELMQLDVSASPETALATSSGASELLDGFKSALNSCTEQLGQGRERLLPCCRMLSVRGELLQKEVLKAEVTLVGQAFAYQVRR
jgi:hypothetical protein